MELEQASRSLSIPRLRPARLLLWRLAASCARCECESTARHKHSPPAANCRGSERRGLAYVAGTVSQVADELEERAMVSKTAAERKAAERARKRQSGLRPYELWLSLTELKAV